MSLSDLLGRTLASMKTVNSRNYLLAASLMRLLLVGSTFTIALTDYKFWNHAAIVIANTSLLGVSNGLLATYLCRSIPARLEQ